LVDFDDIVKLSTDGTTCRYSGVHPKLMKAFDNLLAL